MPTYDYKCNACGHRFEQFQSMKDKSLTKCPSCGKKALERLIGTGAAVLFKGSGFYHTDYRSEGYKKAAAAETPKPAESGSSSASSGAAETKPAPPKAAEPTPKAPKEKKAKPKE